MVKKLSKEESIEVQKTIDHWFKLAQEKIADDLYKSSYFYLYITGKL